MEEIITIINNAELSDEVKEEIAEKHLIQKNLGQENNLSEMLNRIQHYGAAIPTGYSDIDKLIKGGFRQGLNIIAAPPGMGKTTLSVQLAEQFSAAGLQTIYLANDMSEEETVSKALSRHSYEVVGEQGFGADEILGGQAHVIDSRTFGAAIERFKNKAGMLRIEGDEMSRDLSQIKLLLEVYGAYGTGEYTVVIIDYLQNIQVQNSSNAKERLDTVVKELKSLAKRLGLIIIAISSVNRGSYHSAIQMESLKESGDIEFGADLILGIQYEGVGNENFDVKKAASMPIRKLELVVLKQRLGGVGLSTPIKFYPKFNMFPWYDRTPKFQKTSIDFLTDKRK